MSKLFAVVAVAITLLWAPSAAHAFVASPPDLKLQARYADVICVGRVVSITYGEPDSKLQADYKMVFHVDRVMKGDLTPNSTISVFYSQQLCYPRYHLSGYDLLLLSRKDGRLVFSSSSFSSVPVSSKVRSTYRRSDDVEKNLRWEIMNTLQATPVSVTSDAITQARLLADAEAIPLLKKFSASSDPANRANALDALVLVGDRESISLAIGLVSREYEKPAETLSPSVISLGYALEKVAMPTDCLPALGAALTSHVEKVRMFALRVLRFAGGPGATPYLKTALYDSSQDIRYDAIRGLAERAKDYDHVPVISVYRADEDTYLNYWKSKSAK